MESETKTTRLGLETAAGALEFVKMHCDYMRDAFAQLGELRPMAVLFARHDPDSGAPFASVVPIPVLVAEMDGDDGKEGFAEFLRGVVARTKAVGVLVGMECWCKTMTAEERDAHSGSLENVPGRGECLQLTLEHAALPATRAWRAMIRRDAAGKAEAAAFEEMGGWAIGGRFAGLLPPEMRQ